ncbi:hypothetical protein ABG067_002155 [Albugo candida]
MEAHIRSNGRINGAHHPVHPQFVRRVGGGYVNTQLCPNKSKAKTLCRSGSVCLQNDRFCRRELMLMKTEHKKLHKEKELLMQRVAELEQQREEWKFKFASLEAQHSQLQSRISGLEMQRGCNSDNKEKATPFVRENQATKQREISNHSNSVNTQTKAMEEYPMCQKQGEVLQQRNTDSTKDRLTLSNDIIAHDEHSLVRRQIAIIFFYCGASTKIKSIFINRPKTRENARIAYLEALVVALKNENSDLVKKVVLEKKMSSDIGD